MKKNKNIFAVIGMIHKLKPAFIPVEISLNILVSLTPFLNLYLGAILIDGIVARKSVDKLMNFALILVGINLVTTLIRWILDKWLIIMRREIDDSVDKEIAKKQLTLDYQILEKRETLDYIERAKEGVNSSGSITDFCRLFGGGIQQFVTCVYGSILLVGLLKSNLSQEPTDRLLKFINSPLAAIVILLMMAGIIWINYYISKQVYKREYEFFAANVENNRQFSFFTRLAEEYPVGKDIRIFKMQKMIKDLAKNCGQDYWDFRKNKLLRTTSGLYAIGMVTYSIFQIICYFYVGLKAISGAVSIGELTLYVGALLSLSRAIVQLFEIYGAFELRNKYLSNYVDFLNIKNEKYDGTLPIEKRHDNDYELEFRNVSFHYPNSDDEVLHNITAKIYVGKKMAIVGKNGSGKSTFIKLLCRLYDPTEGEILLNGIDIRKYDYDEYRQIFSVVFQDFHLFSFPIACNVAASVDYDANKVKKCLMQAGIGEYVEQLEHGIETVLYKEGDDDGVEISGGEAQKIAIARALYKDAPVVILDEPTAALDPVSELEIYERFDEMVDEKTAIYISHRMSSCRFCENILVFDNGNIIQMGSHDSLVAEDGLYRELWEAQAQYYR